MLLSIFVRRYRSSVCLLAIFVGGAPQRGGINFALLTSRGRDDRISFGSSGRGMILGLERMRSNTHPPITHHNFRTSLYWLRLSLIQDTGSKVRRRLSVVTSYFLPGTPYTRYQVYDFTSSALKLETVKRKVNRTSTVCSCAAIFVQISRGKFGNERPPSRRLIRTTSTAVRSCLPQR